MKVKESVNLKSDVLSSLIWKLMEQGGASGVQILVQIILARLLMPEDYGLIALISVFILVANVFVQSGFNTALIQKKDADETDFSSVFYMCLFIAMLLYVSLFFISPYIADFYREPQLILILRILSISLFFGAINSIQNAFLARNMMFKKLFFSSLGAIIFSGIVGIVAAYSGLGVWAIVVQQLTHQLFVTVALWFTVMWRPRLLFSINRVKILFSFGSKLLASGLINVLYTNISSLIIGRIYSPTMLGYYNRGELFPKLIVTNIDGSIQSVMFPALSSCQHDKRRVKDIVRRSIVTSSFIMLPMMTGLAVVAEPVIKIILTDKWLPAVPFLRIFCASYAFWPIHTANLQAINALGRSDIFLKLEIAKKTIGIIILGISIPFGVYAMAWGILISGIIATVINAFPNSKLLNYSYIEQWKDIIPSFSISILMGAVIYFFSFLNIVVWGILIIQIIIGTLVYIGLSKVLKIESYTYLVETIKDLYKSRRC